MDYPEGGSGRIVKIDADFDDDSIVSITDLLTLLANFDCTGDCDGDVNGDGVVDLTDLLELLALWG